MKQLYTEKNFGTAALSMISTIDGIVVEYQKAGYRLTVRQLYYQLVARGVVENTIKSYNRVAEVTNDAKLAGLIDWDAIEDRTRAFVRRTRWKSGAEIVKACVASYHEDMWATQHDRVFVVVEKEALAGVLEQPCNALDVPLLAARGYPSGTVLREFAVNDIIPYGKQHVHIIHLGDHDPSGIDMTRDLRERIALFCGRRSGSVSLTRIALNMPQIEELQPPENPAKSTDSRYADYRSKYGDSSWELDALPPEYLDRIVRAEISSHINQERWDAMVEKVDYIKEKLKAMGEQLEE